MTLASLQRSCQADAGSSKLQASTQVHADNAQAEPLPLVPLVLLLSYAVHLPCMRLLENGDCGYCQSSHAQPVQCFVQSCSAVIAALTWCVRL